MEKILTQKEIATFVYMKYDHCGLPHIVRLMYSYTDLNICEYGSSARLSSPKSKVSIIKLSRICIHVL